MNQPNPASQHPNAAKAVPPVTATVPLAVGQSFFQPAEVVQTDWEALYYSTLSCISEAILLTDETGSFTFISPNVQQVLGYTPQALWQINNIGRLLGKLELPEALPQTNASHANASQTNASQTIEAELFDAEGHRRILQVRIQRVAPNNSILFSCSDITHQHLQQHPEREQLLASIAQRIRQSLDLDDILQTTVTEIQQLLKADRVLICRISSEGTREITTETVVGGYASICKQQLRADTFIPAHLRLYEAGQIRVVRDVEQDNMTPNLAELMQRLDVKSKVVVPILQQDLLWGLLIVHQCQYHRDWQPWEVSLLQQLATNVAIAIQQSELYQQVRRLNADLERQVRKHTAQLQLAFEFEETLKRITDRVRDSLDEGQILQTAVRELTIGLGIASCNAALFNLDEGTSTVYYEYTTLKDSYQGRVSQMSLFPELYDQLLSGQYFQFCSITPNPARGPTSMLACPIFDDRGVLGDLWLINQPYYVFGEQDVRLVQQVANQCAIAIRQARLYQAAQAQVTELERLNQLKDDFLSTVSHELRTPVSNIKMATQMLDLTIQQLEALLSPEPQASPIRAKAASYLQILKNECAREINLINDLLDLQRLEMQSPQQARESILLQSWLPQRVEPFRDRIQKQQQCLKVQLASDLPQFVSDASDLERIVAELLNNACKYTPSGETITISASMQATWLQLQVRNSGVEIPDAEMSRIFDKFYRIPSCDPWKQGGTGLGLALVQKLVCQLGGSIAAQSENGYTQFTVKLPLLPLD